METLQLKTNAYATQCIAEKPNLEWYPTTSEEIKAFLGAQIVMEMLPVPAHDMYWYKDKLFHSSCLEMKFSRNRYENMQRNLHVADTSANPVCGNPGHDKLAHVRPILEEIRRIVLGLNVLIDNNIVKSWLTFTNFLKDTQFIDKTRVPSCQK